MKKYINIDNLNYEVWIHSLSSYENFPRKGDVRIIEGIMFYVDYVEKRKWNQKFNRVSWRMYISPLLSDKDVTILNKKFESIFR